MKAFNIQSALSEFDRDYQPAYKPRLLSKERCEALIHQAEQGKWHESNFGQRHIYSLPAAQIESVALMLNDLIPPVLGPLVYEGLYPGTVQVFRYLKGDAFEPHTDKAMIIDEGRATVFTIVVYLNDCQGGATRFTKLNLDFAPKQGDAILFPQGLLHEGRPVLSEKKYILRAQIIYQFNFWQNPSTM
jgi:hypothetical protein